MNKKNNTYIIAEIGNTHEGSLALAKEFAKTASEIGVDCVKFQTHIFSEESIDNAPNPPYFKGESRKEYFKRTSFSKDQWLQLKKYCESNLKVDFLSSPFSIKAAELLKDIGLNKIKVPSGELTNILYLDKISKFAKVVFLSTGMSNYEEIDLALEILQQNIKKKIYLLQCTSVYPCPPQKSGLNVLNAFMARYPNVTVGFSDHTNGISIPFAAVTLGAKVIEKHFTLSKKMYGADAKNATEPKEFKQLVDGIRNIDKALKVNLNKNNLNKHIIGMKNIFQKSIVSKKELKKNSQIQINAIDFKKPGIGIEPKNYKKIINKKLKKNVKKDHIFKWSDFY